MGGGGVGVRRKNPLAAVKVRIAKGMGRLHAAHTRLPLSAKRRSARSKSRLSPTDQYVNQPAFIYQTHAFGILYVLKTLMHLYVRSRNLRGRVANVWTCCALEATYGGIDC